MWGAIGSTVHTPKHTQLCNNKTYNIELPLIQLILFEQSCLHNIYAYEEEIMCLWKRFCTAVFL